MIPYRSIALLFTTLLLSSSNVYGHGGVSLLEDDVCIIKIGFMEAHFRIFQPDESGSEEFCEDIPKVAEGVFIIDYLHDFLREMPIDFRILKDSQDLGFYARWSDLEKMDAEQFKKDTVFWQRPSKHAEGVYSAYYQFDEPGTYIGVVSAQHPTEDKTYYAVFPFQVGKRSLGHLPLFFVLIVLAQGIYWYVNRSSRV
jgi:hypothetical protein